MVYLTDSANDWLLPVGVFLPVAGLVVMGFIPRTGERLLKVVALLTALAQRPSASSRWPPSTTTRPARCSST